MSPISLHKQLILAVFAILTIPLPLFSQPDWAEKSADAVDKKSGLFRFENCKISPVDWADGDSFQVEVNGGKKFTVRLYGVDCFETTVRDNTDARRLRSQRRWFGLVEETPQASMKLAREMGEKARARVSELLSKPFTVITAFTDGRGDARFERFYGFVILEDGRDLASVLVKEGWARAYGVVRSTWDGKSRDEYIEFLRDLELTAASGKRGAWAHTSWEALPEERRLERAEDAELSMKAPLLDRSVNPNTASRDELQSLPGIGESIANRMIEGRQSGPYKSPQDLDRVEGLGEKKLQAITPFLVFE